MNMYVKAIEDGIIMYSLSNISNEDVDTDLNYLYYLATHYADVGHPDTIHSIDSVKRIDFITNNSYCIIITVDEHDKCLWTIIPVVDDKIILLPVFNPSEHEYFFEAKERIKDYTYNTNLVRDITYNKLRKLLINSLKDKSWCKYARTDLVKACYGGYFGNGGFNDRAMIPTSYFYIKKNSNTSHVAMSYATRQTAGIGMHYTYSNITVIFDPNDLKKITLYNSYFKICKVTGLLIKNAEDNEIDKFNTINIPIIEFESENIDTIYGGC